jgi:hypothetical protein
MRSKIYKLTALSALAVLGMSAANASVIAGNAAGGSEALATFVNLAGDSITQDLGEQMAGIEAGDAYTLSANVLGFISSAGGASNISFGIMAGNTLTRTYLHSSANPNAALSPEDGGLQVANSAKSLWSSSLNGLVQNLNDGDATPAATNNTYGTFLAGLGSPNYIDGGHDNWQSGDFQFSNLSLGTDPLLLYTVTFAVSNLGLQNFAAFNDGLAVTLTGGTLQVGSVAAVPAPAGVWLLGTALLPLARRALRKARTPA